MCYWGCRYEDWEGDCRKPYGEECPLELEERYGEQEEWEEEEEE